jgi:rare lipoprotein A
MRILAGILAIVCATVFGAASSAAEIRFSGNVSWYGGQFHGKRTASGRLFDMNKLTCAHRTLPFGTKVLVENPRTGQSVIVEVTDRGPFISTRVMDLSREAARQLGTLLGGIAYVDCLVIDEKVQETNRDIQGRTAD